MALSLDTPIELHELAPRTTDGRSFFIEPDPSPDLTLYERTQTIHGWEPTIGCPNFELHNIEGAEHATIATGLDSDGATPVWQIRAGTFLLHGQVGAEASSWQLASFDHQGRMWQEAVVDEEGSTQLTDFVLASISKVSLNGIAGKLLQLRSAARRDYEAYRTYQEREHRGSHKRLTELLNVYASSRFSISSMVPTKNMVSRNPSKAPRQKTIEQLPELVKRVLGAADCAVDVPTQRPI